jgi:hypothetical protein
MQGSTQDIIDRFIAGDVEENGRLRYDEVYDSNLFLKVTEQDMPPSFINLNYRIQLCALMLSLLACGCTIDNRNAKGPSEADATLSDGFVPTDVSAANIAPGPLSIQLVPSDASTVDALNVEITEQAFDPDEGPLDLSVIYRWFRNEIETPHGGNTLPSQATKRGETWRVEVAAFDGALEGPMSEASITIINAPPSVLPPSLTPQNPEATDVLNCLPGQSADPDNDDTSMEYAWFVGGELQQDEHTSALLPPLPVSIEVSCAVRAFDGQAYSEWMGSNVITVQSTQTLAGMLYVTPKALDLGTVLPEETATSSLTIRNIGDGVLTIASAEVEGLGFSLATELPLTLQPKDETELVILFQTDEPGLKKGKLVLDTNATNPDDGSIPLIGLGASPCLTTDMVEVDFGGVYPPSVIQKEVVLTSCGALSVTVETIQLSNDGGAPFELDLSQGPGPLPWELKPGETTSIFVTFSPNTASPIDENGKPIPFTSTLTIDSNTPAAVTLLDVQGFASPTGCPVAQIISLQGNTVLPGTNITLSGTESFGVFGQPGLFAWSVSSVPEGQTIAELVPSAADEQVSYNLASTGLYEFHLKVFDQTNPEGGPCGAPDSPCTEIIPSCTTATKVIEAKEAIPLIVELTWDTPGDPSQLDTGPGKGADMDLHMHNGMGQMPDYDGDGLPDSFFDHPADCYWFDATPDWGQPGAINDPNLVLEDADGGGPERIELQTPANGHYTVGVHYWSAFDYGPSVPTIRVYHFETLIHEVQGPPMQGGELWEVLAIDWPSSHISSVYLGDGGPKVTPAYPTKF